MSRFSRRRVALPIDSHLPNILQSLAQHRALVLAAAPGTGKTTRIPPAIVNDSSFCKKGECYVLLEPRRVAARAVARRIADENGWKLGQEVGYQVRFERQISAETRLRVMTEGVLTRKLIDDPYLEGIRGVILDEFHERSVHTDLAIALLKELQSTVREDLKIIVMSATIDTSSIAAFLGDSAVHEIDLRAYPVETRYLSESQRELDLNRVVRETLRAVRENDGDALVFLPGAREIERVVGELSRELGSSGFEVLPLYGALKPEDQDRVFQESSHRRVVVATNIAETSITLPKVRIVVDSGFAKVMRSDPSLGIDRLELGRISLASAAQRRGRAGRTAPGVAVRLWSRDDEHGFREFETPEIHRVNLAATLLSLLQIRGSIGGLEWFDAPRGSQLESASQLLRSLGAMTEEGALSEIGKRMLGFAVDPRIARVLVEAENLGCYESLLPVCATLSESGRVPTDWERGEGTSDLRPHERRWVESMRGRSTVKPGLAASPTLFKGDALATAAHARRDAIVRALLSGFSDWVGKRRADFSLDAILANGRGARIGSRALEHAKDWFLALSVREDRFQGRLQVRVDEGIAIAENDLRVEFAAEFDPHVAIRYDATTEAVTAWRVQGFRAIDLRPPERVPLDPSQAGETLYAAIADRAEEILGRNAAFASWLTRYRFWRKQTSTSGGDVVTAPEFDADAARQVLELAVQGCRSVAEVASKDLVSLLSVRFDHAFLQRIDREAPEAIRTPRGRTLKLVYENERVLGEIKIQDAFGWPESPRIMNGKVTVVLDLLAPNYRPIQRTDSLSRFWASTYSEVRKELRGRYPKHAWPENPMKPE